jgi:hypothetical protein
VAAASLNDSEKLIGGPEELLPDTDPGFPIGGYYLYPGSENLG